MIGEEKFLSLLVVSVLVISGFAVISGRAGAEEGELVSEVEFNVVLNVEDGIASVYEEDTHMFMHGIDGWMDLPEEWRVELDRWEALRSYNNLFFNPAHEGKNTTAMQEAIDEGWIDEPEEVRWLANDKEGEWTVNPFAHNDIRFAMQYLNRGAIIEELLDGLARPEYGIMESNLQVWQDYFVESIQEEFGIGPEGDEDYMAEWIEKGMEEIQEEVAFGEVRFDEGYWQYKPPDGDWHNIEVIILARLGDLRPDLGEHVADILEDVGFDAFVDLDVTGKGPMRAFFGVPEPYDNLDYHIYTGRWVSTQTEYYQHAACAQMYAPWYGFLQTYGPEEHWQYDDEGYDKEIAAHEDGRGYATGLTVEDMDNAAQDLYYGDVQDEEDYWEKKVETTQLGFMESLRVFLVTTQDFYVYNPDKMLAAVPEAINGYDTYFGPRTMRTHDGRLDTEIMTGGEMPYMDNWNKFGGSRDVYGEYQRRMLREYGSWNHPQTGIPMEVNNYWSEGRETDPWDRQGEIDVEYNDVIPEGAVDYVPAERKWLNVTELVDGGYLAENTADVKVTIDVHEEHVWHDGNDFTLQDVMAAYARDKELGNDTHEPYLESWESQKAGWWSSISAIEWNEDDGTYTVYGDYSFPVEDLIGDHYSMFPEVHPLTYEGWNHLYGGDDTEYGGLVDDSYGYEPSGEYWVHQISSTQNEDLLEVLNAMYEDEWIPYYLRADRSAPMPMDATELTNELGNVIDFIDTYEHSYIGLGPFWLEDYDEDDRTLTLQRHKNYGFPFEGEEAEGETFEYGYWSAQFEIEGVRLDSIDAPEENIILEEFEASAVGVWEEIFPERDERALTEDDLDNYRFALRDVYPGEIYEEVPAEDIELTEEDGFSTFVATIPTENVPEVGTYVLHFEVLTEDAATYEIITTDVTLSEGVWNVEITSPEDGTEFEEGDTVTVEYTIVSQYAEEDTQDIVFSVDEEEVDTENVTIEGGGTYEGEFTWEADEEGDYELKIDSDDDWDMVDITVEEEDDDGISGFTLVLLLIACLTAAGWYQQKNKEV